MIVVGLLTPESGTAFEIAARAAATGARVEMVGAAAPGPSGDERLLELAAATVGHATVIRSGADSLEPADLDLALRYLPDIRAVVLIRPPARLIPTAMAGVDYAGATLLVVEPQDPESVAALQQRAGAGLPMMLEPGPRDPEGAFAGFVAALAVRLDAGEPPDAAFQATIAALAIDPA